MEPITKRIRAKAAAKVAHLYHESRRAHSRSRLARSLPRGSKLHLGCGPNKMPGWVNIDINRYVRPDLRLDFRFGLPAPADSIALIYSEHVLEHLSLAHGLVLLSDCHRALAPGGVLRIAMPDLQSLVHHYIHHWWDHPWLKKEGYAQIDSAARMLNFAMREWGHQYVYDRAEIDLRLEQVGFSRVEGRDWGESNHPELRGLETRGESNLIVEAVVT